MHFLTTVIVRVPTIVETIESSREDKVPNEFYKARTDIIEDASFRSFLRCHVGEHSNCTNAFSHAVADAVIDCMAQYDMNAHFEFEDSTDYYRECYEKNTDDFVCMPNGRVLLDRDFDFTEKFTIIDGLVYEKDWGPLKTNKRTKRAKKIKYLRDYPIKKLYKSFEDYCLNYLGAEYNEQTGGYGYYYNPNWLWDWYRIGGRWPKMFLVKSDCSEYSIGNIDDIECLKDAPEGYKWTSAARKKDICWDAIVSYHRHMAETQYRACKSYFEEGKTPEGSWLRVEKDGIYEFDKIAAYIEGETLEENLKRLGYTDDISYLMIPCFLVDSDAEDWYSEEYVPSKDSKTIEREWVNRLRDIYGALDDDAVLVTVDVHQ